MTDHLSCNNDKNFGPAVLPLKEGRLYFVRMMMLFIDSSGRNKFVDRKTILMYLGWAYHQQLLQKRHVFMTPTGEKVNLHIPSTRDRAGDFITNYLFEIDTSISSSSSKEDE
jgi:hypothetical protein